MNGPQQQLSYEDALAILGDALAFGIEPSLAGITALMAQIGNPHTCFVSLQVAGTNGKSSTARFLAAFLRAHGLRVGLYTSPELVFYEERMELDGHVVTRSQFAAALAVAHEAAQAVIAQGAVALVTEFELLTAAALWLFAHEQVDFAVLEAGLGGRWDATSVVNPAVAVITGVDFDHTAILGNTIEAIAAEKAAVIKPATAPILGPGTDDTLDVFLARVQETCTFPRLVRETPYATDPAPLDTRYAILPASTAATLHLTVEGAHATYSNLRFNAPRYQAANIACAIAAAEAALGRALDPTALQQALDTLTIPGRFETLRSDPLLLIDAAHNPQSAHVLAQALDSQKRPARLRRALIPPTLLLGILRDKDAAGIIDALVPLFDPQRIVATQSTSPRAIPAPELAQLIEQRTGCAAPYYPTVAQALDALDQQGAHVVATGSITLAGEVKRLFSKASEAPNASSGPNASSVRSARNTGEPTV